MYAFSSGMICGAFIMMMVANIAAVKQVNNHNEYDFILKENK